MTKGTAHTVMADWLAHFEPSITASGKPFDKDMEAASLALALDVCGFDIIPKTLLSPGEQARPSKEAT